jgi:polysaccharide export outer membrane protein
MKIESLLRSAGRVIAAVSLLIMGGCVAYRDLPAGTVKEVGSPVVERQVVEVAGATVEPQPSADYVIGVNDVLSININGKPEFFAAPGSLKVSGSRVDGNGRVNLPLAGPVEVAGLTISQAQSRIQAALRTYLQNPWVVVEVADYKSRPLYLLGQFKAPGTFYMDRPLNLVQGIALGSGPDNTTADLRGASLSRGGKLLPVDIQELLVRGDARQNIWLKADDTIYIPDTRNQQVFVFGAVLKPGPVPIPPGGLNLAQAIASTDFRNVGYDMRYIRIIRSLSAVRGELIVVDFDRILKGETVPFQLMGGDVVYVPKSGFGTWNDAINEILPSLQAVSAMLQPFVAIKFLSK